MNVTLNNSTTLSCEMNAHPAPIIYWEKDGLRLNGSIYSMTKTVLLSTMYSARIQNNLLIPTAKKEDFGSFKCVATNSVGNLTQTTHLNIHCKYDYSHYFYRSREKVESMSVWGQTFVYRNQVMSFLTYKRS